MLTNPKTEREKNGIFLFRDSNVDGCQQLTCRSEFLFYLVTQNLFKIRRLKCMNRNESALKKGPFGSYVGWVKIIRAF